MIIQVRDLFYTYRSPFFPDHQALSNISFTIDSGEMVALVGSSGSGKTTLIQHFNGIFKPTSGFVFIDGLDLSDSKTDLEKLRKKIGLVFQFPESQLFEESVEKDVAFGLKSLKLSDGTVRKRVRRSLDRVGLDFRVVGKYAPFHLSGGEKRRAAIAGILVMEPEAFVLDEPTAGLDWSGTCQIENILKAYHRTGRTVVFVSHDMDLVARLADRVLVLSKGVLIFDGKKEVLFQEKALLKRVGLLEPQVMCFMGQLKSQGIPVRTDVFSVGEARREIRKVLLKKAKREA